MSNVITLLLGVIGGVLLYFGADFLIKGGVGIAKKLRIPSLIIGLTMMAFGTSAPELTVSIASALQNKGDISVGNVLGSNICNLALILGLCAIVKPLPVNKLVIKSDMPVMLIATLAFSAFLGLSNGIPRWGGIFFVLMMATYIVTLFINSKRDDEVKEAITGEVGDDEVNIIRAIFEFAGGLAALVYGAKLFVSGAVCAAKLANVPEAIIALTVVAIGTSLPELAASMIATIKGENDIAVGNIVGSNIWNILCIMGVSPIVNPIKLQNISWVDMGVMLFVTLLSVPFFLTGRKVSRAEGAVWLLLYLGYLGYLVATQV